MKLTPARLALLIALAIGAPYVLAASSGPTPSPTPDASPTVRGVVNTGPQSFAGNKTWNGDAGFTGSIQFLNGKGINFSETDGFAALVRSSANTIGTAGYLQGSSGVVGSTFTATNSSGANGVALQNNGARVDLGTGASDYLYSDGTTVFSATDFAVPSGYGVTGDVYFSNAGKSGELWGRKTTGTGVILNNDHTLGSGDKLLSVRNNSAEKVFVSYEGTIQTAGGVSSTSASGSDAFYVTTNGARFHFGAGASDYATSDGTTVTFAGPIKSVGVGAAILVPNGSYFSAAGVAGSTAYYATAGGLWNSGSFSFEASADVGTSGTSVAAIINNRTAFTTSGDKLLSVRNGGTEKAYIDKDGAIKTAAAVTVGTITLAAGTGTATVLSGAKCVCTDSTANASVKCAVASTTLTATGTGTDVITYICL